MAEKQHARAKARAHAFMREIERRIRALDPGDGTRIVVVVATPLVDVSTVPVGEDFETHVSITGNAPYVAERAALLRFAADGFDSGEIDEVTHTHTCGGSGNA